MSEYEESLESLTLKLTTLMNIKNKETGKQQGYIGLIIRDPSVGNVDVIHNCTNIDDLINILKITITSLEKKYH